jgi:hypothetical protein
MLDIEMGRASEDEGINATHSRALTEDCIWISGVFEEMNALLVDYGCVKSTFRKYIVDVAAFCISFTL